MYKWWILKQLPKAFYVNLIFYWEFRWFLLLAFWEYLCIDWPFYWVSLVLHVSGLENTWFFKFSVFFLLSFYNFLVFFAKAFYYYALINLVIIRDYLYGFLSPWFPIWFTFLSKYEFFNNTIYPFYFYSYYALYGLFDFNFIYIYLLFFLEAVGDIGFYYAIFYDTNIISLIYYFILFFLQQFFALTEDFAFFRSLFTDNIFLRSYLVSEKIKFYIDSFCIEFNLKRHRFLNLGLRRIVGIIHEWDFIWWETMPNFRVFYANLLVGAKGYGEFTHIYMLERDFLTFASILLPIAWLEDHGLTLTSLLFFFFPVFLFTIAMTFSSFFLAFTWVGKSGGSVNYHWGVFQRLKPAEAFKYFLVVTPGAFDIMRNEMGEKSFEEALNVTEFWAFALWLLQNMGQEHLPLKDNSRHLLFNALQNVIKREENLDKRLLLNGLSRLLRTGEGLRNFWGHALSHSYDWESLSITNKRFNNNRNDLELAVSILKNKDIHKLYGKIFSFPTLTFLTSLEFSFAFFYVYSHLYKTVLDHVETNISTDKFFIYFLGYCYRKSKIIKRMWESIPELEDIPSDMNAWAEHRKRLSIILSDYFFTLDNVLFGNRLPHWCFHKEEFDEFFIDLHHSTRIRVDDNITTGRTDVIPESKEGYREFLYAWEESTYFLENFFFFIISIPIVMFSFYEGVGWSWEYSANSYYEMFIFVHTNVFSSIHPWFNFYFDIGLVYNLFTVLSDEYIPGTPEFASYWSSSHYITDAKLFNYRALFNSEHATPQVLSPVYTSGLKDYILLQFKASMPSKRDLEGYLPIQGSFFVPLWICINLIMMYYGYKIIIRPFFEGFNKNKVKLFLYRNWKSTKVRFMHFTNLVELKTYFKRKQSLRNKIIKIALYGSSSKKCR